jgi:FkbM family methyltransferase
LICIVAWFKLDTMSLKTVRLEITLPTGGTREVKIFDNDASEKLANDVLGGHSYPHVPFIKGVETVVDVGANVGLSAVWLSMLYSPRRIIAVEPSPHSFSLLRENAESWPAIEPHNIGLYNARRSAMLHLGVLDCCTDSIYQNRLNTERVAAVELEDADSFLNRLNINTVDVLKIDTEGCEIPILESIKARLLTIRVVYLEYHSDEDRRRIDALLAPTHLLTSGRVVSPHRGEFCYVARSASRDFEKFAIRPAT